MKKSIALLSLCIILPAYAAPTWKERIKTHAPWAAGVVAGTLVFFARDINGTETLAEAWDTRYTECRDKGDEMHLAQDLADLYIKNNYPIRAALVPLLNHRLFGKHTHKIAGALIVGASLAYGLYAIFGNNDESPTSKQ